MDRRVFPLPTPNYNETPAYTAAFCCFCGAVMAEHTLLEEAERQFRAAVALAPESPEPMQLLAAAAREAGLHAVGRELVAKVLAADPACAAAYNTLGLLQRDEGEYREAIESFQKAIALGLGTAEVHSNLADAFRRNGQLTEAIEHSLRAVLLDGGRADSHFTLGNTLYYLGRPDEAMDSFQKAISLDPCHAGAHRNVAVVHFLRGNFAAGYEHYEWRWRITGFRGYLEDRARPRWNGEPLGGRTLLLHAEQGLGDTLQFVRYVGMIEKQDGRIILQVQPALKRLLQPLRGVDQIIARGEAIPVFDVHCPLLSLPRAFRTTLETIPQTGPYVEADRELAGKWMERVAGDGGGLRVGVAWRGNPKHTGDRYRSIPLGQLAAIFELAGVRFYSLQKMEGRAEAGIGHAHLINYTSDLGDFAETAAFVSALDLIISVDTAVAHLAGALGKPIWTLLPYAPDWRWLLDRRDTPWYPTMRLFRQERLEDWESVIFDVKGELERMRRR